MKNISILHEIDNAVEVFAKQLNKYSFGPLMSIVGIAIIILTVVLPFLPFFPFEKIDFETKTLFIISGLILIICGGSFLMYDKVLITRFRQKYTLLLMEKGTDHFNNANEQLSKMLTDEEKIQVRTKKIESLRKQINELENE
jgi:hypothetical protein